MAKQRGVFVTSLDFELHWGIRDIKTIEEYGGNLRGERSVIPLLLDLFAEYGIHATWATVGFLFFEARDELIKGFPTKKPHYVNSKLSPYTDMENIGSGEEEDPFHFAPSLIKTIASFPHQEIGSHTFSHYYCLEEGQDVETFKEDLEAAVRAAGRYNLTLESLVFPRNQFNKGYLSVCRGQGIKVYRGNQPYWIYRASNKEDESLFKRGLRLLDAYINISGHNCYLLDSVVRELPVDIPSSRFLRPYSGKLRVLEPLRLRRILSGLTYAASKGMSYHLWWHPHNFGVDPENNILFLRKILDHFLSLREAYGMESLNMGELFHRLTGSLHE